jgi:hypothetical protein
MPESYLHSIGLDLSKRIHNKFAVENGAEAYTRLYTQK